MVAFHAVLTVVWLIALVAMFFAPNSLKQSVTVVIAISVYANIGAHFSSLQAALADWRSPDKEELFDGS